MLCHNYEHCKTHGDPHIDRWFTLYQLEPGWIRTPYHSLTFCSLYCVSNWTFNNIKRNSLEPIFPEPNQR